MVWQSIDNWRLQQKIMFNVEFKNFRFVLWMWKAHCDAPVSGCCRLYIDEEFIHLIQNWSDNTQDKVGGRGGLHFTRWLDPQLDQNQEKSVIVGPWNKAVLTSVALFSLIIFIICIVIVRHWNVSWHVVVSVLCLDPYQILTHEWSTSDPEQTPRIFFTDWEVQ